MISLIPPGTLTHSFKPEYSLMDTDVQRAWRPEGPHWGIALQLEISAAELKILTMQSWKQILTQVLHCLQLLCSIYIFLHLFLFLQVTLSGCGTHWGKNTRTGRLSGEEGGDKRRENVNGERERGHTAWKKKKGRKGERERASICYYILIKPNSLISQVLETTSTFCWGNKFRFPG